VVAKNETVPVAPGSPEADEEDEMRKLLLGALLALGGLLTASNSASAQVVYYGTGYTPYSYTSYYTSPAVVTSGYTYSPSWSSGYVYPAGYSTGYWPSSDWNWNTGYMPANLYDSTVFSAGYTPWTGVYYGSPFTGMRATRFGRIGRWR
jgi:hypothetical protein